MKNTEDTTGEPRAMPSHPPELKSPRNSALRKRRLIAYSVENAEGGEPHLPNLLKRKLLGYKYSYLQIQIIFL